MGVTTNNTKGKKPVENMQYSRIFTCAELAWLRRAESSRGTGTCLTYDLMVTDFGKLFGRAVKKSDLVNAAHRLRSHPEFVNMGMDAGDAEWSDLEDGELREYKMKKGGLERK
jgi:hypothetical protein